jgi:2-polyprenyl-3-methyl-5-hydroxy-6-metoxy-1,4-benzoquinol methylase
MSAILGPSASDQWQHAPEHLAMVMARYRLAAALIGNARTVLELGCGEGIGARILARGREVYHGIDVDETALAYAHDQQWRSGTQMTFSCADARDLPRFGAFDAVVALDVIEHLSADDGALMVEMAALHLMRPGILVVGTPNAKFAHLASPASARDHLHCFTHDELHALLSRQFDIVQSFGMQDLALHTGHPDARHYLLMAGIGTQPL